MDIKNKKPRIIGLGIAAVAVVVSVIIGIVLFGGRLKAATMRLTDYDGKVALTDATGKELSVQKDRKLLDGNKLSTKAESRAYVTLDEDRLVTLMQESKAAFAQSGKALELKLTEGQLFFNIAKSLKDDESLDIRTSTILIGIRGTSGYVDTDENGSEVLYLTSGKVHCVAKSPDTDDEEEVDVEAGQKLTVTVLDDGSLDVKVEDIPETALPREAAEVIAADAKLLETVLEETGWGEETLLAIANGEIESGVNGPVLRVPETVVDGIIHHEYYEVALGEQTTEWLDAVIEACEAEDHVGAATLCGYQNQFGEEFKEKLKEEIPHIMRSGSNYRLYYNDYKCVFKPRSCSDNGNFQGIYFTFYLIPDTGIGYFVEASPNGWTFIKADCAGGMYNGHFEKIEESSGPYESGAQYPDSEYVKKEEGNKQMVMTTTGTITNGLYDGEILTTGETHYFDTLNNREHSEPVSHTERYSQGIYVDGRAISSTINLCYLGGLIPLDELPSGDEKEIYPY